MSSSTFFKTVQTPFNFPKDIASCTVNFQVADYTDSLYEDCGIILPTKLKEAAPTRKADFLAGRYCAFQALSQIGDVGIPFQLPVSDNRHPIWPEGLTGSITHTIDREGNGVASAIVSRVSDYSRLAIDVEKVMTLEAAEKVQRKILIPADVELYQKKLSQSWTFGEYTTLVFSAKESIFKSSQAYTGIYLDFSEAQITDLDEVKKTFGFKILDRFKKRSHHHFTGHFNKSEKHVHTTICY